MVIDKPKNRVRIFVDCVLRLLTHNTFSMNTPPPRRVCDVARGIRARGRQADERLFASQFLDWLRTLGDTPADAVWGIVVRGTDATALQLALVWLDGAGYGDVTMDDLAAFVAQHRKDL